MKKFLPILFFLFSSCFFSTKKEEKNLKCPICPATEKTKEVRIMKLNEQNFPFFKDDGDIKKFIEASNFNIKYLTNNLNKNSLYNFDNKNINNELLLETNNKIVEILTSSFTINEINEKIKSFFDVYEVILPDNKEIIFSSYYEPIVKASLVKTNEYKYPLYAKPNDLITVNLQDFNDKYKGEKITGRIVDSSLVPYYTRDEIDYQNVLKNKNLEIAYLKSMADVMDLHIEGSGILELPDNKIIKAKYAATNSHKFKGWMSTLIEKNLMQKKDLNFNSAKTFLDSNKELEREILSTNKRYTFFKLEDNANLNEGPNGTYGYPLTAKRSIAIDNNIIPFGTLAFMTTKFPDINEKAERIGFKEDSRFVFCQDTGGAIKGGRVDFFAGNGDKAKTFAFSLWEKGKLYLLLLKDKENEK